MVGRIAMAKIIYKEGCEGQNKLSCIEGIEIELLNGQKALIYPKYSQKQLLTEEQISKWDVKNETEIEALKVEDTNEKTVSLFKIGSPAANWALQFVTEKKIQFRLPSLLAALEIQHQKEEIDVLAETIDGANFLKDYTTHIRSCSRCSAAYSWCSNGGSNNAQGFDHRSDLCVVVPTILYRDKN